jgi:hypothetical protein
LSKKIENEKRLLSSSVSFSSYVTSLCNNTDEDKEDGEENEINEENDLSTTLKRGTKRKIDEVVGNETILPPFQKQTYMNSFVSPRLITLTLKFPLSQTTNSSPSSSSISSFHSCSSTKLSTCCSSSLISSYSSPSSLSSSALLQRKSQEEMETGENNFLSQTQSFRQYIFVESLSEYSEERKELQSSTSPSTSGFIV